MIRNRNHGLKHRRN